MSDLNEFVKGKIVGARMVGSSVTRTAELSGFSRATINSTSTVKPPCSNLSNSGRTSKLTDRDRRALKCIVERKHRTTAATVNAELNQHLNSPVFDQKVSP